MDSHIETVLGIAVSAAIAGGLVLLVPLMRAGAQLRATGGPGVAPFQLAESDREANRFLRAWGSTGRVVARRVLVWHFGIIACYVVALGAAALYVGARAADVGEAALVSMQALAAVLTVLAGVANCVANVVLLGQLRTGHATRHRMVISRWCVRFAVASTGVVGLVVLVGFGIVQLAG